MTTFCIKFHFRDLRFFPQIINQPGSVYKNRPTYLMTVPFLTYKLNQTNYTIVSRTHPMQNFLTLSANFDINISIKRSDVEY